MKMLLKRMFDENEFLSDYGIRSMSKYHEKKPYEFPVNGNVFRVQYTPAESELSIFGGNSNWRGPVWFPLNFLIVDSLLKFYEYYGDDYGVEYPTNSGQVMNIREAALKLSQRLTNIFVRDKDNNLPVYNSHKKFQDDPFFQNLYLFYEYFHGDNGSGLGAAHQTGWTGLVADLIQHLNQPENDRTTTTQSRVG